MKLYSQNLCPACEQLKSVLTSVGVEYEVVNISKDASAKSFVLSQGHRSVPQLYSDEGKLIGGPELLKIKREDLAVMLK